jgi:hypothetical protein
MKRLWILLTAGLALAGCTSPEAARQRGGGPGADVGNRPPQVLMHEGSRQYWETPVRIPSESPSLAPSEQARQLSLSSSPRREGDN